MILMKKAGHTLERSILKFEKKKNMFEVWNIQMKWIILSFPSESINKASLRYIKLFFGLPLSKKFQKIVDFIGRVCDPLNQRLQ